MDCQASLTAWSKTSGEAMIVLKCKPGGETHKLCTPMPNGESRCTVPCGDRPCKPAERKRLLSAHGFSLKPVDSDTSPDGKYRLVVEVVSGHGASTKLRVSVAVGGEQLFIAEHEFSEVAKLVSPRRIMWRPDSKAAGVVYSSRIEDEDMGRGLREEVLLVDVARGVVAAREQLKRGGGTGGSGPSGGQVGQPTPPKPRTPEVPLRVRKPRVGPPNPKLAATLVKQGHALRRQKLHREALDKFLDAVDQDPASEAGIYNAACMYAVLKTPDYAISMLQRLDTLGSELARAKLRNAMADNDLVSLRGHPQFQALTSK